MVLTDRLRTRSALKLEVHFPLTSFICFYGQKPRRRLTRNRREIKRRYFGDDVTLATSFSDKRIKSRPKLIKKRHTIWRQKRNHFQNLVRDWDLFGYLLFFSCITYRRKKSKAFFRINLKFWTDLFLFHESWNFYRVFSLSVLFYQRYNFYIINLR